MAGPLDHSPADILCQLLIDLGYGTDRSDDGEWPILVNYEPDLPDNTITIFDTQGETISKLQTNGRVIERSGINIKIRSNQSNVGYAKANDIMIALDEQVYYSNVTIASSTYCVNSIIRRRNIVSVGKENDNKRSNFSLDCLMIVKQNS